MAGNLPDDCPVVELLPILPEAVCPTGGFQRVGAVAVERIKLAPRAVGGYAVDGEPEERLGLLNAGRLGRN